MKAAQGGGGASLKRGSEREEEVKSKGVLFDFLRNCNKSKKAEWAFRVGCRVLGRISGYSGL